MPFARERMLGRVSGLLTVLVARALFVELRLNMRLNVRRPWPRKVDGRYVRVQNSRFRKAVMVSSNAALLTRRR